MQTKFCHKIFVLSLFAAVLCLFNTAFSQNGCFLSLQEAMKQPDSVRTLILKKQHIKEFPVEILQMKNIERLDLSRNSIKEIPSLIKELKNLHYVNFAQNYLTSLPEEMADLPVDTLILWDNQIRVFDQSFKKMKLKFLDIRAILMTRKEQRAVKQIFPDAKIKKDHPCNCGHP